MDNSQQALSQLQAQQQQARNPNDFLSEQRQALGADAARQTVTGLRGAINNTTKLLQQVAPSIMGRTGSSLVTSAQANKQIQNEQAPISQNLSDQSREYGQASQDLGDIESRAAQAASGMYQGQQDKLSYLQNLYNTLYQREQAAEQARRAELERQEQIRQFNAQMAAQERARKSSGGGSFNLTGDSNKVPQSNLSLRQQWQKEANAGDWNAQVALNYAGNDGRFDGAVNSRSEYDILKSMGIKGNYYVRGKNSPGGGGW